MSHYECVQVTPKLSFDFGSKYEKTRNNTQKNFNSLRNESFIIRNASYGDSKYSDIFYRTQKHYEINRANVPILVE